MHGWRVFECVLGLRVVGCYTRVSLHGYRGFSDGF